MQRVIFVLESASGWLTDSSKQTSHQPPVTYASRCVTGDKTGIRTQVCGSAPRGDGGGGGGGWGRAEEVHSIPYSALQTLAWKHTQTTTVKLLEASEARCTTH